MDTRRHNGVAYRVLGDRQAAEDVVQDTFVAVLSGKARYSGRGHPDAFVLRVASFIAIDRAKSKTIRKTREEEAAMQFETTERPTSSTDPVLRRELEAEVDALLSTLSPRARAAVTLRFWDDASVRDIAEILSTPKSTIARWIDGALARLREPLVQRGLSAVAIATLLRESFHPAEAHASLAKNIASTLLDGSAKPTTPLPSFSSVSGGSAATSSFGSASWITGIAAAVLLIGAAAVLLLDSSPTERPNGGDDRTARDTKAANTRVELAGLQGETETNAAGSGASITGRVLSPSGKPAAGAEVVLHLGEGRFPREHSPAFHGGNAETRTKTDTQGRFTFRELAAGTFRVFSRTSTSAPGTSGLIRLGDDEALSSLEIRLREGRTARGQVRTTDGKPVPGVSIDVGLPVRLGQLVEGYWPTRLTSDRRGEIVVSGLAETTEILVHAPRHVIESRPNRIGPRKDKPDADLEFEIVVGTGQKLVGTILDDQETPLAGARVHLRTRKAKYSPWRLHRETTSDANGSFAFRGLKDETYLVEGHAKAFAATTILATPGDETELKLRAGKTIRGLVTDAMGSGHVGAVIPVPEPNAMAQFVVDSLSLASARPLGASFFSVRDDGSFETPLLAAGNYFLVAAESERDLLLILNTGHLQGEEPAPPSVHAAGASNVRLKVSAFEAASVSISGRVQDAEGRALPASAVKIELQMNGGSSGYHVSADQNARFECDLVGAARFDSVVLTANTIDGRRGRLRVDDVESLSDLTITLGGDQEIRGRVIDDAGRSIARAKVELTPIDGPHFRTRMRSTETGDDGSFTVDGMDDSRAYRLIVRADGLARTEFRDVTVGSNEDYELAKEGLVRGSFVNLDGEPVDAQSMTITEHVGQRTTGRSCEFRDLGNGRFEVRGLSAGRFSFGAYAKIGPHKRQPRSLPSDPIAIEAGDVIEDLTLVLGTLSPIEGRVLDASNGQPISGAWIGDWRLDDENYPSSRVRTQSGANGEFQLDEFTHGSWMIHCAADGYLSTRQHVAVDGREIGASKVEFQLQPADELTIEVVDHRGRPIEGASVRGSWIRFGGRTKTDASGRAVLRIPRGGIDGFRKLDPQRWTRNRPHVDVYADNRGQEVSLKDVELSERRIRVTFGASGRVVGRVVDHRGVALEGVSLTFWSENHGRGTQSKTDGSFRVSGIPVGERRVTVSSSQFPLAPFELHVLVRSGQESELQVAIPDPALSQISKLRVRTVDESGNAIPNAKLSLTSGSFGDDRRGVKILHVSEGTQKSDDEGWAEFWFESNIDRVYVHGQATLGDDADPYQVTTHIVDVASETIDVTYVRRPTGKISLRILDADSGKALTGYDYNIRSKTSGSGSRCTTVDGVLDLRVDAAPSVKISVELDGYEAGDASIDLEDRSEVPVTIRLRRK
ncbi:MAG: sigma-70 family RNA polymerase sigma factor [Planctomycetota bacterium]